MGLYIDELHIVAYESPDNGSLPSRFTGGTSFLNGVTITDMIIRSGVDITTARTSIWMFRSYKVRNTLYIR